LDLLKSGFYLELLLRCAPLSYVCVESHVADPSFNQEDMEDPEYTAPDNDCFNGNEGSKEGDGNDGSFLPRRLCPAEAGEGFHSF
jgi:hypothetical protein